MRLCSFTPFSSMPTFANLSYAVDADGIATIALNRPKQLTALSKSGVSELDDAFQTANNDDTVRAIILTGSGEKAFAAGADISEFTGMSTADGQTFATNGQRVFSAIEASGKPVVAAVNGYALGGGCELAMACHMRLASDNAVFGQPEVNLGLIPGYGGTQRLTRLVGRGIATELMLSGSQIDAQRAYEIGLVNAVHPREELLSAAKQLADTIAAKAPLAVSKALEAIAAAAQLPESEGMAEEARLFGECCATDDFKEGVDAFLNRRKPTFSGR